MPLGPTNPPQSLVTVTIRDRQGKALYSHTTMGATLFECAWNAIEWFRGPPVPVRIPPEMVLEVFVTGAGSKYWVRAGRVEEWQRGRIGA